MRSIEVLAAMMEETLEVYDGGEDRIWSAMRSAEAPCAMLMFGLLITLELSAEEMMFLAEAVIEGLP